MILRNINAEVIDEHIQIRKGRSGKISLAETEIKNPSTKLDMSKKAYVRVD